MTHYSLAVVNAVASPNKHFYPDLQFKDGVRGFNFDIYSQKDDESKIWTKHGITYNVKGYDPSERIWD